MNFHLFLFTSLLSVLMPGLSSRLHCAYSVLPLYFLYAPQAVVEHVNGAIISLIHLPGLASIHQHKDNEDLIGSNLRTSSDVGSFRYRYSLVL